MGFETKICSREILAYLYNSGTTLSTAESCTGGRVAESIIACPGASNYFKGGIIAYTDEVKKNLLQVNPATLEAHTAFSEPVAIEMAEGACRACQTDYAIATTGVAGPGGGTPAIPTGTIWIAVGRPGNMKTMKLEGDEGRDVNIANATNKVLKMFLDYIKEEQNQEEK